MKVVNNFDLIKNLLTFVSNDEFYFIQVLVRGKDGHKGPGINGNSKNRLIKYYTVKSVEHFMQLQDEIIGLCHMYNARAYIHPTKRSFTAVAKKVLRETTEMFLSENYEGLKGAYSTACGKSFIRSNKFFIVDADAPDDIPISPRTEKKIIDDINDCDPVGPKIFAKIPTAHGFHLITLPFNRKQFNKKWSCDIHTNNPTLLYFECQDK